MKAFELPEGIRLADAESERALGIVLRRRKVRLPSYVVCRPVAVITGRPGAGKTRLARAIAEYHGAAARDVALWQVRDLKRGLPLMLEHKVVILDNVRQVYAVELCKAVESHNGKTWFIVTGPSPRLSTDVKRRSIFIRLA